MTGQDAVLDAAALEREAHVRAAIVEREDAPAVVDDEDRTMAAAHDEPPLRLQLLKAARSDEIRDWNIHGRSYPVIVRAAAPEALHFDGITKMNGFSTMRMALFGRAAKAERYPAKEHRG